jgi:dienelactone hydrolase
MGNQVNPAASILEGCFMRLPLAFGCWLLSAAALGAAEPETLEKGKFSFKPLDDQKNIPECYRLDERSFDYELSLKHDLPDAGLGVFHLTFPSPVVTELKENNTVHAEYYRPHGKGPFPAVIVLDILGGNETVSRTLAVHLAQHRIAALFVFMPYYGPRRTPGSNVRLLMPDIDHSLGAVRQTVLDLRAATAWLEARLEVDGKRLGILGTSLGSFMATLTAEMEPKLARVAALLGGGGIVDAYYDHPQGAKIRKLYESLGGSKEKLAKAIAPADPLTCAANLKTHKVLMICGKRDEIVPPKMATALWKASGQQEIVWYDCGHYSAAFYLLAGLDHIVKHFGAE